jgi:hypothetical protein
MISMKFRPVIFTSLALALFTGALPAQDGGAGEGLEQAPKDLEKLVPKEPILPVLGQRAEFSARYFYDFGPDWERTGKWRAGSRQNAQQIEVVAISADVAAQTTRVVSTWSDGKVYTEWYYRGAHVAPRSNDKGFYVMGIGDSGPTPGFPELGWVSMATFKGASKLGEATVFVFRQPIGAEPKKGKAAQQEAQQTKDAEELEGVEPEEVTVYRTKEKVAYLDAKTQQPILSNDGQVIRVYTISPAPTQPLVPPPGMIEMLQKRQAGILDRTALPGNPAG